MQLWKILQGIIKYSSMDNKKRVILIGAGQHCNVVMYNIAAEGKYEVACIAEVDENKWNTTNNGVVVEPFKNFDEQAMRILEVKYNTNLFFISFGAMKWRKPVFEYLISHGWEAINVIHPDAVVSPTAKLGKGVLVECGCLVTPSPIIGDNVVINTGSQVNHDNIVEDHVYIASGVILSGGVTIGENTLLDDGVTVTLGSKVGKDSLIGAGAIVTKDIPDGVVAYGNPCKVIRENTNLPNVIVNKENGQVDVVR